MQKGAYCYAVELQLEATSQLEVSKFGMMLQPNIFKRITDYPRQKC